MKGVVDATLMSTMILSKAFIKMHFQPKASSTTEELDLSVAEPASEPDRTSSPCIINVSSIIAMKGSLAARAATYAAGKAGVIGFTRALTAECSYMMSTGKIEERIRVNALLAGYIDGVRNIGQFKLP
jgi:NAD(P)-dependent dehydrogenase (short-subunit alcohol dehydrogenase family)